MFNFSESFKQAHQAHVNWQKDRPLIDKFNHLNIWVALALLNGEIKELNGGDVTGIFSKDNLKNPRIRADYRQQEISDIIIFTLTAYDKLGITADLNNIKVRAQALAKSYNFSVIDPESSQLPPSALAANHESTYEALKEGLNQTATVVLNYETEKETFESDDLVKDLESILVYCVAMHSLLGVNSAKAVMEKIARNMIKYPAGCFKMPEEEPTHEKLGILYDQVRKDCADEFDGKFDEELGDRPKTGTTTFYEFLQLLIKNELGEVNQTGILHNTAVQAIASN